MLKSLRLNWSPVWQKVCHDIKKNIPDKSSVIYIGEPEKFNEFIGNLNELSQRDNKGGG